MFAPRGELYINTQIPDVYLAETLSRDKAIIGRIIAAATVDQPGYEITDSSSGRLLGVWHDDTIVGALNIDEKNEEEAIINFWTSPDFTGLGYATLAVQAATQHVAPCYPKIKTPGVNPNNEAAIHVLRKSGYSQVVDESGELIFEYSAVIPAARLGILKCIATNGADGSHGITDTASIEYSSDAITHIIRKFSGVKNKPVQEALWTAIQYLAQNSRGPGSERLQSIRKCEPTMNGRRVPIWRLKPGDVPTLDTKLLRSIRIVYGIEEIEGETVVAILDILSRGDFEKKYN